jgi:SAM-dependent methyltransferase
MTKLFYLFFSALFSSSTALGFTCAHVFGSDTDLKSSHLINAQIARQIIKNNGDGSGFETRRGLDLIVKMMPERYEIAMNLLMMKGGRYLDSGTGDGLSLAQLKAYDDQNIIDAVGVTARMQSDPKDLERPGLSFIADGRLLEDIPYQELGRFDVIIDNYGPYAYSSDPAVVFHKYLHLLSVNGQLFIQTGHRDRQLVEVPGEALTATITLENYLKSSYKPLIDNGTLSIETLSSTGMVLGQNQYEPYRVLTVQLHKELDWTLIKDRRQLMLKEIFPGNPPTKLLKQLE